MKATARLIYLIMSKKAQTGRIEITIGEFSRVFVFNLSPGGNLSILKDGEVFVVQNTLLKKELWKASSPSQNIVFSLVSYLMYIKGGKQLRGVKYDPTTESITIRLSTKQASALQTACS